jgi:hypothetical protein
MQFSDRRLIFLCTLLIFGVIAAVLFLTQYPLSLDDGVRHIIMARFYRTEGFQAIAGWGEFFFAGYFAQTVLDPWFLADMSYVPFTLISDPTIALKTANMAFLLILLGSLLLFLKKYRSPPLLSCLLILLLFMGSRGFILRMLLARPFVVVSALFLLTLFLILERRYIALAFVIALTFLYSHLFIFAVMLCVISSFWLLFLRRSKDAVSVSISMLIGLAAGFVLHPHGVAYLSYLRDIFVKIPFSKHLNLGGELYGGLVDADIALFFVVFAILLLFTLIRSKNALQDIIRDRPEILLTCFLSAGFLGAYFIWVRAIDYLLPVALVLILQLATLRKDVQKDVLSIVRSPCSQKKKTGWRLCWWHIIVIVCAVNFGNVALTTFVDNPSRNPALYEAIKSVPAGSHVVNIEWEIFPVLLLNNDQVLYVRGMDPSFDYYHDPAAFALFEELNDWWSWQWSDIPGSWEGMKERLDKKRWRIQSLREREDVDLPDWVSRIRTRFDADYLVLHKGFHRKNIKNIQEFLPLHAESPAIAIFKL